MKRISSIHNTLVRKIEQLQRKSRARKSEGLFIIEGQREVMLADRGGYEIETLVICEELFDPSKQYTEEEIFNELKINQSPEIVFFTREVYEKVAYRGSTEGCLAFAKAKSHKLSSLKLSQNPLILIAESPEKPGNIGAILRTADAANVDAVIIVNPTTDLYNPNVIRSSVGCVLTVPTAVVESNELVDFLVDHEIDLYAATLQNSNRYDLADFTTSCAIAVGTEATGLSEELRAAAKSNIVIPMAGSIDSMNVSVSAAILLFEAKRQRNFQ
ncbi:MAG: TrmH family RNA methyltransferase [Nonlabens sp.]